jgi:hypothetical protein
VAKRKGTLPPAKIIALDELNFEWEPARKKAK